MPADVPGPAVGFLYLELSLLDMDRQGWFSPYGPALVLRVRLGPSARRRVQLHVKFPEQPSHDETHLVIGQVLAHAVSGPIGEWFLCIRVSLLTWPNR